MGRRFVLGRGEGVIPAIGWVRPGKIESGERKTFSIGMDLTRMTHEIWHIGIFYLITALATVLKLAGKNVPWFFFKLIFFLLQQSGILQNNIFQLLLFLVPGFDSVDKCFSTTRNSSISRVVIIARPWCGVWGQGTIFSSTLSKSRRWRGRSRGRSHLVDPNVSPFTILRFYCFFFVFFWQEYIPTKAFAN